MTIEEGLRCFRIMHGINQKNSARGIMSQSYYSRIERGAGKITVAHLLMILNKNKISPITYLQQFYPKNFKESEYYQNEILEAVISKDLTKLQKLLNDYQYPSSLNGHLLKAAVLTLKDKNVRELNKELGQIKRKIFQFDDWNNDFLWGVLIAILIYPIQNFSKLVLSIFGKIKVDESSNERKVELLANIAVVYAIKLRDAKKSWEEIKVAVKFLEELPQNENIFLQKLVGKYLEAEHENNYLIAKNIKETILDLKMDNLLGLKNILK